MKRSHHVMKLHAPFPYFGGKSQIAHIVWRYLGDAKHYIEPFFGSGAVLLARPQYDPARHVETVCDLDGNISNVWRSLQQAPDEVARWCDWPVNHVDMYARRKVLMEQEGRLVEKLVNDDTYCDPKLAGYWIWFVSCKIGRMNLKGDVMPKIDRGIENEIPHIGQAGRGVHKLGIVSEIPQLTGSGMGVHRLGIVSERPHLSGGQGVHKLSLSNSKSNRLNGPYIEAIYIWFRQLSERLRRVRVVCGSWERVCGGNWQDNHGAVGIFLDPPYGIKAKRDTKLYHIDSLNVADKVREWALERGKRKTYRIVLAGYYEEHEELLNHGWKVVRWKGRGGYAVQSRNGNRNRFREALFISPFCEGEGEHHVLNFCAASDSAS